jgi:dipeptidyl aminopeptidase/acylaminoacyl peptidase
MGVVIRTLLSCLLLLGSAYNRASSSVQPAELLVSDTSASQSATKGLTKRHVTVADSIEMTRLADQSYTDGAPSSGIVAKFSPDGKHFVIVLKRGDLERNINEYSLVLFETAKVFESPGPEVLISLGSSSNRSAIDNVLWLDDNDTILFLGERAGEPAQLYSLECSSKKLRKLTNHATSLTSFVSSANGETVVYAAENPAPFLTNSVARTGIAVTSDLVTDLIRGSYQGNEIGDVSLFVKRLGKESEVSIATQGRIWNLLPMLLSPDGAHLLVQVQAAHIHDTWHEYEDKFLQMSMRHPALPESRAYTYLYQYELVDTFTGGSQVLVDAPIGSFGSEMAWSPDSKSVVVSDVFLPLNVDDPAEHSLRKEHTFLVEFAVASRQFVKISHDDLKLKNWDPTTGYIACDSGRLNSDKGQTTPKVYFWKSGEIWSKVAVPEDKKKPSQLDILLVEDMNSPPRIVAVDPIGDRKSLLMDLNPQFRNLTLARVEEVTWKDSHGNEVKGGLYWPPDYVTGQKYPVVIQTHGWNRDRFWMDGPWPTAFAAQALASNGFFVVQVPDPDLNLWDTPKEALRSMASYEGAIDYLDRRRLIDRNRVGITGFSRTYWYVTYTLTRSKYHFAACALADGVDYGYFQYMAFSNASLGLSGEYEHLYGGLPFGKGLAQLQKRAPAFHMDKVKTPLRIQTMGPTSVLGDWQWYSGLSQLGKPVEMIYLPEGTHILEKPWDRIVSQQGNVDWFRFWLKDEEDADPAKVNQYKRWRELRNLQDRTSLR